MSKSDIDWELRGLAANLMRERDALVDEVRALRADIANLRAGNCLAVIPETFIACGEGGNYCSEVCRMRPVVEAAVRYVGPQGEDASELDTAVENYLALRSTNEKP